ncbi:MAG: 3-deoxy-D-manno-octulosonic acid transferase, partial [Gemmatimonadales bacterium]
DLQIVYTHYSPSAVTLAQTIGADWSGYLCYDRAGDVDRMLTAAAPELLVFTKLDLWPELTLRAHARGTRVAMVAATVDPQSTRLRWPSRTMTRDAYAALDAIAAVSNGDADRLAELGCDRERITVCGDPRVDSVLDAVDAAASTALPADAHPESTLVAGSTWPADENVVLEAFRAVRQSHPAARLIMAPHEPTAKHLAGVDSLAARLGLPAPVRSSQLAAGDAALVLVDETGKLARLYALGIAAYVGGGFGRRGIHSVLEPAAWSRPVVIGPHDRGNRDAKLLERAGGLVRLTDRGAVAQFARTWRAWMHNASMARRDGEAARAALARERGASMRSAAVLTALLVAGPPGASPARLPAGL